MNDDKKIEEYLRSKGVRIEIGGCGCCESPWVKIIDDDGNEVETKAAWIDTTTPKRGEG